MASEQEYLALFQKKVKNIRAGSGGEYMGLCPFHDEKTPSFSVLSTRGIFHCFGCGKEGDSSEFQRLITQELNDWLYKIDKK